MCGVKNVLWWFGHVERDRIAKSEGVFKERDLDVRQVRRMVQDRSE